MSLFKGLLGIEKSTNVVDLRSHALHHCRATSPRSHLEMRREEGGVGTNLIKVRIHNFK